MSSLRWALCRRALGPLLLLAPACAPSGVLTPPSDGAGGAADGSALDLAGDAESGKGSPADAILDQAPVQGVSGYSPDDAVAYAEAHWDDGAGECAEFTSRSLDAGNLPIGVITWVPTLVQALAQVRYDEYSPDLGGDVGGLAGDVVVYSNDRGDNFCLPNDPCDYNCGHVGLIVVAGAGRSDTLADFHNHAHLHLPIGDLLGSDLLDPNGAGYSTYRVYHLAPPATPCVDDASCNGGASGSEWICSDQGECITGCHSDSDCPPPESCTHTSPHWSCG